MATRPVTVNDALGGHEVCDLESFDRIYLNGYGGMSRKEIPGVLGVRLDLVGEMPRHLPTLRAAAR